MIAVMNAAEEVHYSPCYRNEAEKCRGKVAECDDKEKMCCSAEDSTPKCTNESTPETVVMWSKKVLRAKKIRNEVNAVVWKVEED